MRSTTAIVTGASQGIGRELALNLAQRGIDVIAVARNEDALKTLQKHYPERIHIISADVGTEEGRNKIELIANEFGKIDYLVNNAAIITPLKNLENVTQEELTTIFNINVFAAILLSSRLLPLLKWSYLILFCCRIFTYGGCRTILYQQGSFKNGYGFAKNGI